jgi:hypothetical protein
MHGVGHAHLVGANLFGRGLAPATCSMFYLLHSATSTGLILLTLLLFLPLCSIR